MREVRTWFQKPAANTETSVARKASILAVLGGGMDWEEIADAKRLGEIL